MKIEHMGPCVFRATSGKEFFRREDYKGPSTDCFTEEGGKDVHFGDAALFTKGMCANGVNNKAVIVAYYDTAPEGTPEENPEGRWFDGADLEGRSKMITADRINLYEVDNLPENMVVSKLLSHLCAH